MPSQPPPPKGYEELPPPPPGYDDSVSAPPPSGGLNQSPLRKELEFKKKFPFLGASPSLGQRMTLSAAGTTPFLTAGEVATDAMPYLAAGGMVAAAPAGIGIAGASGLAALGGAFGEEMKLETRRLLGAPKPEGMAHFMDLVGAAAEQGAMEAAPRAIFAGAKGIYRVAKGKFSLTPEQMNLFQIARDNDLPLTYNEIVGTRFRRLLQYWSNRSAYGLEMAKEREKRFADALGNAVNSEMSQLSPSVTDPYKTGASIFEATQAAKRAWAEASQELYGPIEEAVGDTKVDTGAMRKAVKDVINEVGAVRKKLPTFLAELTGEQGILSKFLSDTAPREAESLVKTPTGSTLVVKKTPVELTFSDVKDARSLALEAKRAYKEKGDWQAVRVLNKLDDVLKPALDKVADSAGLKREWDAANEFHREGAQLFYKSFIADIFRREMRTDPGKFVQGITRNDATKVAQLKDALHNYDDFSESWDLFRRQFVQNLFRDSNGQQLSAFKDIKGNISDISGEMKSLIFGDPRGRTVYANLGKLAEAADRLVVKGRAEEAVVHDVFLAAAAAAYGRPIVAASAMMRSIIPAFFSRAMGNVEASKMTVDAMRAIGQGKIPAAMAQLTRAFSLVKEEADKEAKRRGERNDAAGLDQEQGGQSK